LLAVALIVAGGVAAAQTMPWQKDIKRPQDVVYLFPEQVTVAAGKDAVVDLHFKVNAGMHINSHEPHEKSLIATRLIVAEIPGLKVSAVDFPAGSEYALAALPNDKLSVYTGEFVLHAHIRAAVGQHVLQAALRYQACDSNSCYPPRQAPVALDVIAK
jgi:hypothetical protein